jgi:oxalate decarboxylase/phosphoglucose isomerase-like protein (cupin superfamily)
MALAGDYVFVPRGTPHTYRNPGPAPSAVLNIISPPDGLQLLAELGALAGTSVNEELLAEIHTRHAASIVTPLPGWQQTDS